MLVGFNQEDSHEFIVQIERLLSEGLNESEDGSWVYNKDLSDEINDDLVSTQDGSKKMWDDCREKEHGGIKDIFAFQTILYSRCSVCEKLHKKFEEEWMVLSSFLLT